MRRFLIIFCLLISAESTFATTKEYIWPKGKMPSAQDGQIAAMTSESQAPGFDAARNRAPYLEWFDAPAKDIRNGGCMILISGGSYKNCCDTKLIEQWRERFTALGFQCVNLVYRTPRPQGLPIYQSAWEDGQRAVRLVRSEARKRGYDPERIGTISMSAGSHLALLLGTSSLTRAYEPVDKTDSVSCHINWAIVNAPAYGTTDGEAGTKASLDGYGADVRLSDVFKFDEKTCPMSFHHGGKDPYTPMTSTLVYRRLRAMGVPAELHLYPNKSHGAFGLERGVEFMRQMGFVGPLEPEELLMDRFASDSDRASYYKEDIWPEGKIPSFQEHQCVPYIEWHIPDTLKTTAIQIIYSGGGYKRNNPDGFEVAPVRRYLNAMGVAVVTLKYRGPRPEGLAKHTTAWQDLQRTVRLVRSEAASHGLDPDRIGIMGGSAGGHLTVLGVTSSLHQTYLPVDQTDKLPCNVQWGIAIYPAYILSDGVDRNNLHGGNTDADVIVPEFSFDLKTSPMLLLHGDADGWAAMNSVKLWEKMRMMGIQCELHTLALRGHCFQKTASPGTGSYTWIDRVGEYVRTQAGF